MGGFYFKRKQMDRNEGEVSIILIIFCMIFIISFGDFCHLFTRRRRVMSSVSVDLPDDRTVSLLDTDIVSQDSTIDIL
jgi:hypothetical protein